MGSKKIVVDLQPTLCNICRGTVVYGTNRMIYGREYGSGRCYMCLSCGAYVGTHESRPKEALGILADEKMRELKRKCHDLFDVVWMKEKTRKLQCESRRKAYRLLAKKLGVSVDSCHFGYFDADMLNKALLILQQGLIINN